MEARRSLLLAGASALLLLTACFDEELALLSEPGDPSFIDIDLSCAADTLHLVTLVDGSPVATNLVVEVADAEGNPVDTLFPLNDLTQAEGRVTRWKGELAHDCDQELRLSFTAYTAQETEASTVALYPQVDPDLEGLTPPFGSDLGGSVVALSGDFLEGLVSVLFGEEEATVLSIGEGSALLETPPHAAGPVDVVVSTEAGQTTLEQGFTYYPDQAGLARGIARPTLFVFDTRWITIGSPYVTLQPGPFFQLDMLLHEPVDEALTYLGSANPAPGECAGPGGGAWVDEDYGSYTLMEGFDNFALSVGAPYRYVEGPTDPDTWYGQVFDLTLPEGSSSGSTPAQTLIEAFAVPAVPQSNVDWQNENPQLRGGDLELTWVDDGSLTAVYYIVYGTWNLQPRGQVACSVPGSDEGLTMPWSEIEASVNGSAINGLVVMMEFWQDTRTPFAHDNSHLWSRERVQQWSYHPLVDE